MELTHASFFSGVGGLDLGLERAGFRTVSFSEIDPYASAVLAERWPGVPNLGDIVELAGAEPAGSVRYAGSDQSNAGSRIEPPHGALPAESAAATRQADDEVSAVEGIDTPADQRGRDGLRSRTVHRADRQADGSDPTVDVGLTPSSYTDARSTGSSTAQASVSDPSQTGQDAQTIPSAGEAHYRGSEAIGAGEGSGLSNVRQRGNGLRPHPAGSGWGTDRDGQSATALPPVPHPEVSAGLAWQSATLWSGGFPCQDLSVAGKRGGMGTHADRADTRSGLAYAFLDLVERHRPRAILLENVPGLLSSNGGRDFGALLGRLGELGYWWAYRILDAQFFGVPQRRRRVFILAFHAESGLGADSAAEVLSVGSRCDGHSAAGDTPRPAASDGLAAGISRALSTSQERLDGDTESFIVSPSPDPGGVREADGLAGRLDNREVVAYRKSARVSTPDSDERWVDDGLANTLNSFDVGDIRTTHAVVAAPLNGDRRLMSDGHADNVQLANQPPAEGDPLLPLGLDSHRYRCCGNGVVSNVSEWIGVRLAEAMS